MCNLSVDGLLTQTDLNSKSKENNLQGKEKQEVTLNKNTTNYISVKFSGWVLRFAQERSDFLFGFSKQARVPLHQEKNFICKYSTRPKREMRNKHEGATLIEEKLPSWVLKDED